MNAMEAEIDEKLMSKGKPRYKYRVNELYYQNHTMSRQEIAASVRNKKQYIGEFYDFTKTDQENIEIMKEYGLVVSIPTLKRWKKENGIRKYKKSS